MNHTKNCRIGAKLVDYIMKFQVGILLLIHDACIYRNDLFDIWKEVANRKLFVRCGYGLDLR